MNYEAYFLMAGAAIVMILAIRHLRQAKRVHDADATSLPITDPAADATAPTVADRLQVQTSFAEPHSAPKCKCGAPATEPTPTLARGRGSFLRDLVGAPPRYRRVVPNKDDKKVPLVWCSSHAHVADAAVTEFCEQEVRAILAKAYAQVAARAAAFELEDLPRKVEESLTDEQRARVNPGMPTKRAAKRKDNGAEENGKEAVN